MSKVVLSKEEIKVKYKELLEGKTYSPQQRGFEFEKLIYSVLYAEGLEPRAGYKPEGEQVDGSFFWQGQTFLLEAKWVQTPLPASSIYSFKGKLDGKFHTTSGIFISVNGYSDDVEDALKFGKSLNILLFDKSDIPLIFNGDVTFTEILKFKLRQAGDTGSLQVSYSLKEKAEEISKLEPTRIMRFAEFSKSQPHTPTKIDDLLVFVEGKTDIPLINNFIKPIKNYYSLSYRIEALNGAGNIRQLPSLLNIYGSYNKTKAVIVILDNDQAGKETNMVIQNIEEQFQNSSIYVRPIFLFIDDSLKKRLSNELSIDKLRNEPLFERLELFIRQIAEDYYDPEIDIPLDTLNHIFKILEWDFNLGIIMVGEDEAGRPYTIESLEDFISYLNDEVIQAMSGEMPLHWLKEQEYLDYETEVREFVHDYYSKEIDKLGWNTNDL